MIRAHVLICGGTGCTSSGSHDIQKAFAENIESCGLADEVKARTDRLFRSLRFGTGCYRLS